MTSETDQNIECDNLKLEVERLSVELEQATHNLLKHEYEGGMAEMSVGVLHNIGNTLTPSKIAISMLLQRLDKSPLRRHMKNILQPLEDSIPVCELAEEEKQKLLKIIQILPGSLEEEYEQNIQDVEKIRDKQEHIASIIALHMRYSHLKADYCEVSVTRIIEDAISIQHESINRRGIEINKQIKEIPYIKIQESKLLQILVNLFKNAYESIDLNPKSSKQIDVQACIDPASKDQMMIKIKDTGAGFSSGSEQAFFDFGYTSKTDGSGFGLHFCAHFLKSIGGDITAHSDGDGRGAEFTIHLPIH